MPEDIRPKSENKAGRTGLENLTPQQGPKKQTSEIQHQFRIQIAAFCWKKKKIA